MLNQDFKDILSCLENEKAEFIIVGAFALSAHGLVRATGDINIWVRSGPENARRVLRALAVYGAPISEETKRDLNSPDLVLQIGVAPFRIDIMTNIDGIEFDDAWKNKVDAVLGDKAVPVLSKADLLTNKLASGRDKDLSDIAWLRKEVSSPSN